MNDPVEYYLQMFRESGDENAFFGLVELGEHILPQLIEAYYTEHNADVRAFLVEVAIQVKSVETLSFLEEALHDEHDAVWKHALDGIVANNSATSVKIMEHEKKRLMTAIKERSAKKWQKSVLLKRLEWIDEAINQMVT